MNILDNPSKSHDFDHFQSQFQSFTISSHSPTPLTIDSSATSYAPGSTNDRCTLGAPFSMSYNHQPKEMDDGPTIIDTFSPKPLVYELSPTSSDSSDLDSHHSSSSPRSSFEAFVTTRSRVVRLYNLPRLAEAYLSAVFLPQSNLRGRIPAPVSMWTLRDEYREHRPAEVWAVFGTHEEAAAALSLSSPALSVATALESDLEPFHKLRRFVLTAPAPVSRPSTATSHPLLRVSSSNSDLRSPRASHDRASGMDRTEYTISSNPPNPRTNFRLGDWICSSPKCAAHNFGRNLACIGCGCPRSNGGTAPGGQDTSTPQSHPPIRNLSSPRFASYPSQANSLPTFPTQPPVPQQPTYNNYAQPQPQPHHSQHAQQQQHPQQSTFVPTPAPATKSAHPLLTPSGRAFAVGGKVQNISSDPLSPCIMYWPDNEPFPEQGQIRPGNLIWYSQQPPILNTGNRGPISHQPGDWVCLKCNYLNWRRRKVCQTCLPYAEGNGDSISAAVQAERIALLTSVLAQAQSQGASPQAPPQAPRSHSMTPPQQRRSFMDVSPPQTLSQTQPQVHAPVYRSHSHVELGAHYHNAQSNNRDTSPIYQTSGPRHRQPSPLYSTGPDFKTLPVHAPAPLLPSFLQDIVQSPALSPTSTSSADLSFEESEGVTAKTSFPRAYNGDGAATESTADSPLGNIWRLDGEESKSLSGFALPNHQDLIGTRKKNSREALRLPLIAS
ncbi:putative zinc finger domain containing protein [Lyophyllum shimeji]|uniref:Zinc finger domain containing protein n=1 Tax=Lyophyllum shimeji TaxID=47721 RepID=A0A9P3PW80_LYOSH|nr:putative zinc finger domain containing protein [Lyophyllum shimeji]